LLDLARLDHESSVTLEPHVLPEVAEHFQTCWSRFVSEDGTSSSIAPTAAGQVSRPMITMHSVQVSSVAQFLPHGPSVRGSADAVSARVLCRKSLHAHDLQAERQNNKRGVLCRARHAFIMERNVRRSAPGSRPARTV
jgi:hypothetical protein